MQSREAENGKLGQGGVLCIYKCVGVGNIL